MVYVHKVSPCEARRRVEDECEDKAGNSTQKKNRLGQCQIRPVAYIEHLSKAVVTAIRKRSVVALASLKCSIS